MLASKPSTSRMAVSTAVVILACIVVQIGFGGYGIVLKKFAQGAHANAVVFSFFRDGCCFPVLLVTASILERGPKFPRSTEELGVFCLLGVTGMWGNQLFYILGLYYTNATIASCWQPAIPVFAAVIAIVLRVEPFPPLGKMRGWFKLIGILCAAGGALVLTLGKPGKHAASSNAGESRAVGNAFLFANCFCMALYLNIQKIFIFHADKSSPMARYQALPTHVTAWSYFFGAIAMIITAVVGFYGNVGFLGFGKDEATDSFHVPKQMLVGLAYAVFISSALCYGLISFANKHLPATVVSAFWPLQVPVAVLLASCPAGIFGKPSDDDGSFSGSSAGAAVGPFCEHLTGDEAIGGLLIIIGLFSVTFANHLERGEAELKPERNAPLLVNGSSYANLGYAKEPPPLDQGSIQGR